MFLGLFNLSYKTCIFYVMLHKNYDFVSFLVSQIILTLLFAVNFCIVCKTDVIPKLVVQNCLHGVSLCDEVFWMICESETNRGQKLLQ